MKRARNPPAVEDVDWDAVVGRLLTPRRDEGVLREVRRVAVARCPAKCRRSAASMVATLTAPDTIAEAWEIVAPPEWVGSQDRGFVPLAHPIESHEEDGVPTIPFRSEPTSLELVAALASDVVGVTQAEALAREYGARLLPWLMPSEARWGRGAAPEVAWTLLDPYWGATMGAGNLNVRRRPGYAVRNAVERYQYPEQPEGDASVREVPWYRMSTHVIVERNSAVTRELRRRSGLSDPPRGQYRYPQEQGMYEALGSLNDLRQWLEAARRGFAVTPTRSAVYTPPGLVGRRFEDLPNPYEPLARLFELGYVIASAQGGTILLGAPWPGSPISGPTWASLDMRGNMLRRDARRH